MAVDTVTAGSAIAAIGALGVAAFGLVDVFKTLPNGGLSNAGYHFIEQALQAFFCGQSRTTAKGDVKRLFDTLHGSWINGTVLTVSRISKTLAPTIQTGRRAVIQIRVGAE